MTPPTPSHHPGLRKRHADFGCLAEALDYAARSPTGLNFYSGKGALIEALPYRLLREQAIDLARRMLGTGLRPGDRIVFSPKSSAASVRVFSACQYAGLVPAPLPLPAAFGGKDGYVSHLRRMIESAQVAAAFGPAILEAWLGEAVAGLDLKIAGTLALLDDTVPIEGDLPKQNPDGLSYLQFSSGSTRFPLGIAITQRAFMANARGMGRDGLAIVDGDRGISWLPFYHDMGLVGFLLTPVTCQMTVDIIPTRDFARRPLSWLNLISRNRCTVSYSPSFGYELCARRAETASTNDIDLSSWRSAGIGGDMIRPNVLARFAERFASPVFLPAPSSPTHAMPQPHLALSFMTPGHGARHDTVDGAILETTHHAVPAQSEDAPPRPFVLCGGILPPP